MRIGVPTREPRPASGSSPRRPRPSASCVGLGYDVVVERGAGDAATFRDEAYEAAGATVGDAADVWAQRRRHHGQRRRPTPRSPRCAPGATLVAMIAPGGAARSSSSDLAARGVTALALDAVPRISRAQALDVLSHPVERGRLPRGHRGRRGVRRHVHRPGHRGRQDRRPRTVFVIGAGVAGLAAIGAAGQPRRPGARVRRAARGRRADRVDGRRRSSRPRPPQQEVSADGYASALTRRAGAR